MNAHPIYGTHNGRKGFLEERREITANLSRASLLISQRRRVSPPYSQTTTSRSNPSHFRGRKSEILLLNHDWSSRETIPASSVRPASPGRRDAEERARCPRRARPSRSVLRRCGALGGRRCPPRPRRRRVAVLRGRGRLRGCCPISVANCQAGILPPPT